MTLLDPCAELPWWKTLNLEDHIWREQEKKQEVQMARRKNLWFALLSITRYERDTRSLREHLFDEVLLCLRRYHHQVHLILGTVLVGRNCV